MADDDGNLTEEKIVPLRRDGTCGYAVCPDDWKDAPNDDLVETLEELLERARSGTLRSLIYAGLNLVGEEKDSDRVSVFSGFSLDHPFEHRLMALAAANLLQRRIQDRLVEDTYGVDRFPE